MRRLMLVSGDGLRSPLATFLPWHPISNMSSQAAMAAAQTRTAADPARLPSADGPPAGSEVALAQSDGKVSALRASDPGRDEMFQEEMEACHV
mmetsp:Transcript_31535/g.56620  ORF Transcript_31535/g.56620 Transcript_31535/m.56620 type:complete len:93 (+) Transcript_31535:47-325(+)